MRMDWEQTLVGSLPTIGMSLIFVAILIIGVNTMKDNLTEGVFQELGIIIWAVVMLNLIKIIPSPVITYHEDTEVKK